MSLNVENRKGMLSPRVEETRINFGLRYAKQHGFKIFEPEQLIKDAIDQYGDGLAVSCSWGNCSVAILKMALDIKPDITVIFDDTTVEYPETYQHRNLLLKEWNISNYVETKPIIPFWQCWKTYGPPTVRRRYKDARELKSFGGRRTFQEKTGKPACCWFCKDKPMLDYCKEKKIVATLTGLRCSESRARMFMAADYGQYHLSKRYKIMKYHPILFWSSKQLSTHFRKNQLPMNEVYTKLGLPRNGCMPCTSYLHFEKFLAKYNPKMLIEVQRFRLQWKQRKDELLDNFQKLEDAELENCLQASKQYRQAFLEDWFDISSNDTP